VDSEEVPSTFCKDQFGRLKIGYLLKESRIALIYLNAS